MLEIIRSGDERAEGQPAQAASEVEALRSVHVAATPSPRCAALLRGLPATVSCGGRRLPVALHADVSDVPWEPAADALLLVLVDAPARALAVESAGGARESLLTSLLQWREVATRALRCVHRHPDRCVLVDVSVPGLEARELMDSLGLAVSQPQADEPAPGDVAIDVVDSMLQECAAAQDPSLNALHEELQVSCSWPATALAPGQDLPDALEALLQYRLSNDRQDELDELAAVNSRLTQDRELLIQHVEQLEQAAAALQARLEGVRTESQVHQRDQALGEARQLRQEALLRERVYRPGAAGPGLTLRAEGVRLTGRVDTGDHRHLDFSLGRLVAGERTLVNLHFRLLEHHGRPGLALFAAGKGQQVLGQWEAHGQEAGQEFMLLVPSDGRGRALLQKMGTSDWRLACTVAQLVSLELSEGHADLPAGWRTVASRLGRQLSALPPRLRYNGVSVRAAAGPGAGAIDLAFVDPLFGASPLGALTLRWWPSADARGTRLQALAPADGEEVALSSWPASAGGLLQAEYVLPVGAAWSRAQWAVLPDWDRELLHALLDALPGIAPQASEEALPSGWSQESLAVAATRLNATTRRALQLARLRSLATQAWRVVGRAA
jgi:hypothetical protein